MPWFTNEATSGAEPMQLGFTHLTPKERECRMQNQPCLYRGQAGHLKISCTFRPSSSTRPVSVTTSITTSASSINLPVKLLVTDAAIATTALLDSGAVGNLLSTIN